MYMFLCVCMCFVEVHPGCPGGGGSPVCALDVVCQAVLSPRQAQEEARGERVWLLWRDFIRKWS